MRLDAVAYTFNPSISSRSNLVYKGSLGLPGQLHRKTIYVKKKKIKTQCICLLGQHCTIELCLQTKSMLSLREGTSNLFRISRWTKGNRVQPVIVPLCLYLSQSYYIKTEPIFCPSIDQFTFYTSTFFSLPLVYLFSVIMN